MQLYGKKLPCSQTTLPTISTLTASACSFTGLDACPAPAYCTTATRLGNNTTAIAPIICQSRSFLPGWCAKQSMGYLQRHERNKQGGKRDVLVNTGVGGSFARSTFPCTFGKGQPRSSPSSSNSLEQDRQACATCTQKSPLCNCSCHGGESSASNLRGMDALPCAFFPWCRPSPA